MCLEMSQDDLRDILKPEFYDQIVLQYPTYTGDNLALYDPYIKKYLAWQTYFNYLKFANVEATPTGIRTFRDDNSDIASDIQMYSLEKNVMARAVKYRNDIINFLRESQLNTSTKYPLWTESFREEMSFAITSVDKRSDALIRVNQSIISNE